MVTSCADGRRSSVRAVRVTLLRGVLVLEALSWGPLRRRLPSGDLR